MATGWPVGFSRGRFSDREMNDKETAEAFFAFNNNAAVMSLDYLLYDGQSESGSQILMTSRIPPTGRTL